MKISGIILIAGNSTRYKKNYNKNFENLGNKKIFEYSIDAFNLNSQIDDIILVTKKEEFKTVQQILDNKEIDKPLKLVIGGNSRNESVYNALNETTSDIVIIQDGARPLIKQSFINNCINTILSDNIYGVSTAVKSKDTIKVTDINNIVVSSTNRDSSWLVQTPQCFNRDVLINSYKNIENFKTITDDCAILEKNNYKVKLIPGDYTNIKITTPEDILIASAFMQSTFLLNKIESGRM